MPYTVFTPKRKSFLLALDNTKWHYAHNYYGVPSYTAKPWHRKIPLSLRTSLPEESTPQNLHVTLVDVLVVLGVFTGLCWLYWGIIKLCQILEEWEEWTQTQEEWEAAQRATCDNPAVGLRAFTPSEMRNNWVWDYINIARPIMIPFVHMKYTITGWISDVFEELPVFAYRFAVELTKALIFIAIGYVIWAYSTHKVEQKQLEDELYNELVTQLKDQLTNNNEFILGHERLNFYAYTSNVALRIKQRVWLRAEDHLTREIWWVGKKTYD
ncbi:8447_t:CDS:2, partial [Paraglomus brasilianum]